jgi:hypothetical protein
MADDMKTTRRTFIGGAAAAAGWAAMAAPLPTGDVIRPEDFGAKGDGVANDSQAFAAMSAHVNRRGGGTIVLRKTTYLVGRQVAGEPDWAFTPGRVIELRGLRLPLVIRGNGARLKCAPGLRYGSFDRRSGAVANIPMPHSRQDLRASPYWAMIIVMDSTAPVEITDLELDGSINELRIGGGFGDSGIQIAASGIFLRDNHDTETVRNVHSHHHGQDGVMVDGDDKRRARSRFEDVVCEYNGRQGMSLIGGRGYDFLRCKFNHTGRSKVASAPVAGFDIEAEGGKVNRDMTFTDCEFSNNVGCGMVADSNDSEGATFTRCKFIGTTNWSAWPCPCRRGSEPGNAIPRLQVQRRSAALADRTGLSGGQEAQRHRRPRRKRQCPVQPLLLPARQGRAAAVELARALHRLHDAAGGADRGLSQGQVFRSKHDQGQSRHVRHDRGRHPERERADPDGNPARRRALVGPR